MKKQDLELKWVKPSEIDDNPLNWREHPDQQTDALDELIFGKDGIGWAGVGLVNDRQEEDGWLPEECKPTLIDGHDRKKVAAARDEVMPVMWGRWTPDEEKTILTTLDPIASLAQTNTKALGHLMESVNSKNKEVRKLLDIIKVKEMRVDIAEKDLMGVEDVKRVEEGVMPNRIYDFRLDQLVPNDWSAHAMSNNEFARLKTSLTAAGLMLPLLVRPLGDGKYEIVDGMQRFRAAKELGWTSLSCIIRRFTDSGSKLANLATNRLTGKFIPQRLAAVLNDVRDEHGDDVVTKTTGMEKKRMDSFGEASGYEFNVDAETGVPVRDYREYGPSDYIPVEERVMFMVYLTSDDFALLEDVLGEITPKWDEALPELARQWRDYVESSRKEKDAPQA